MIKRLAARHSLLLDKPTYGGSPSRSETQHEVLYGSDLCSGHAVSSLKAWSAPFDSGHFRAELVIFL